MKEQEYTKQGSGHASSCSLLWAGQEWSQDGKARKGGLICSLWHTFCTQDKSPSSCPCYASAHREGPLSSLHRPSLGRPCRRTWKPAKEKGLQLELGVRKMRTAASLPASPMSGAGRDLWRVTARKKWNLWMGRGRPSWLPAILMEGREKKRHLARLDLERDLDMNVAHPNFKLPLPPPIPYISRG